MVNKNDTVFDTIYYNTFVKFRHHGLEASGIKHFLLFAGGLLNKVGNIYMYMQKFPNINKYM